MKLFSKRLMLDEDESNGEVVEASQPAPVVTENADAEVETTDAEGNVVEPSSTLSEEESKDDTVDASEAPVLEEKTVMGELFCAEPGSREEDGLMWYPILPVGELKVNPMYKGKAVQRPLRIVEGKSPDPLEAIGLQDIVEAFEEGAIQHVTIPLSHNDKTDENTGFIRKLRVSTNEATGKRQLEAGHDFTEPQIKEKVQRGTIANRSCGIEFGYVRKTDGKKFPAVLQHVALTNRPWIPGMKPYGALHASEQLDIIPLMSTDNSNRSDNAWSKTRSLSWQKNRLEEALENVGDFLLEDLDGDVVLLSDEKGKYYSAPYLIRDDKAEIYERSTWTDVELADEDKPSVEADEPSVEETIEKTVSKEVDSTDEASKEATGMKVEGTAGPGDASAGTSPGPEVALSDAKKARLVLAETNHKATQGGDKMAGENGTVELSEEQIKAIVEENKKLREETRKAKVDARIEELSRLGLSEHPGLLKKVREYYLSDDGEPATAVYLSEGAAPKLETVTEIVDGILDVMPKDKDNKFSLSEQHVELENHSRPEEDTEVENMTARERADYWRGELGIQKNLVAKK